MGFRFAGRKQSYNTSQVFPCGLVESGISANQVADHVPSGQVQSAFGGRALASDTEHCGQKQMRCAEGFFHGRPAHRSSEHVDGQRISGPLRSRDCSAGNTSFPRVFSSRPKGNTVLRAGGGASRYRDCLRWETSQNRSRLHWFPVQLPVFQVDQVGIRAIHGPRFFIPGRPTTKLRRHGDSSSADTAANSIA